MTLICPMAVWFVCSVALHACIVRVRRPLRLYWRHHTLAYVATTAVLLLVAGSSIARAASWQDRVRSIRRAGLREGMLELGRSRDVFSVCRDAHRIAERVGTNIIAFPEDGTANYACPALYPELLTIYPSYERRFWVLDELASQPTDRLILWGVSRDVCKRRSARGKLKRCDVVEGGKALDLRFAPRPPLEVLRALGYRPRPFGPGCTPIDTRTCSWWQHVYD
jgi:hypothetical protein